MKRKRTLSRSLFASGEDESDADATAHSFGSTTRNNPIDRNSGGERRVVARTDRVRTERRARSRDFEDSLRDGLPREVHITDPHAVAKPTGSKTLPDLTTLRTYDGVRIERPPETSSEQYEQMQAGGGAALARVRRFATTSAPSVRLPTCMIAR